MRQPLPSRTCFFILLPLLSFGGCGGDPPTGTCAEAPLACSPNGECVDTDTGPRCVCRSGYVGDGILCEPSEDDQVEILRDLYAVPHIYATSHRAARYGWGYVDAEDHRELLLQRLYAGVGRSVEKFGESCTACVSLDGLMLRGRIPEAVRAQWSLLEDDTTMALQAYADGVNAFFEQLSPPLPAYDPDDPVTAHMVAGNAMVVHVGYGRQAIAATLAGTTSGLSNQFALTGDRTAPGTTLVVKDPHSPWNRTRAEQWLHLSFNGYDIVGNAFDAEYICGASSFLAFGCTTGYPVAGSVVRADARSTGMVTTTDRCGDYLGLEYFDHAAEGGNGGFVPFDMRCFELGSAAVWLYDSRFGTVERAQDDNGDMVPESVLITQPFAETNVRILDYLVAIPLARSATEFFDLYSRDIPPESSQNHVFGTRDHQIGFVLSTSVPDLPTELDWLGPVSSRDPRIDSWTGGRPWSAIDGIAWHNIDGTGPELPHVLDPVGDFVENANGHPTYATEPIGQVGVVQPFLARRTGPTLRDERLRELIIGATDLDVEDAKAIATDIRVRAAEGFAEAIRCAIDAAGVDPVGLWGDGGTLLQVLLEWRASNYGASPDSVAMTVLYLIDYFSPDIVYPEVGACLTRAQLDALGVALRDYIAVYMRTVYAASHPDPLRVPWGYVNYTIIGGREVGLPGGSERLETCFPSYFQFDPATGRSQLDGRIGSWLTQVTSYTDHFETHITSPHGQVIESLFPDSPHVGQTTDAFTARQFRRMWVDRAEVEDNLCPYGDSDSPDHDPSHEHATVTHLRP